MVPWISWKLKKSLQNQNIQLEFLMRKVQVTIPKNGETFIIDKDTRPMIRYLKFIPDKSFLSKEVLHIFARSNFAYSIPKY